MRHLVNPFSIGGQLCSPIASDLISRLASIVLDAPASCCYTIASKSMDPGNADSYKMNKNKHAWWYTVAGYCTSCWILQGRKPGQRSYKMQSGPYQVKNQEILTQCHFPYWVLSDNDIQRKEWRDAVGRTILLSLRNLDYKLVLLLWHLYLN